ncbi:ABC transporter permease [Paenalcaligenes niemegkensis]|uniref:ABC transporter permease n=1 Tax=Paenalcaligenes niemegkensis TaxID=2895469 RepID=UPI001EE8C463|nr:ABC transporter permease [Paenalcaligenes niemegkensis]MCQ9618147.1 ABC transporter permease [Paenalcaligenes niemegkensis]
MRFLLAAVPVLLKSLMVLVAVLVINFTLVRMAPGDPVSVLAGEAGASDQQFLDQLRQEFNLDQPVIVQLGGYLKSMASFDLGFSYRQQQPVWDLIADRLPATLILTLPAFVFSLLIGVLLGVLASKFRGTWKDSAITAGSLAFYATPIFWVGLMLVLIFSVHLGWFPPFGFERMGSPLTGTARWMDIAHHAFLPIVTLAAFNVALYARMTRASMNDVQTADYVKTAWAKGLSPSRVVWVHQLRNAVLPVITLAGLQAGQLIGGSVLVETVFAWPGVGRLAFDALMQRDYQILLGVFFCTSVVVVALNLLTDLLYVVVDPRMRSAS